MRISLPGGRDGTMPSMDRYQSGWATMVLARGGTAALTAGGWDRTKSAIVSAVLAEGLFLAVEIKDYYYYEFSPGDFTFNTLAVPVGGGEADPESEAGETFSLGPGTFLSSPIDTVSLTSCPVITSVMTMGVEV